VFVVDRKLQTESPGMTRSNKHYDALDPWLEEAKAGAPDQWLSEQSGVPLGAVPRWRNARGIRRKAPEQVQEQYYALLGLAKSYDPKLHVVESELSGSWDPPQYLLREPLNYSTLCRIILHLHLELEMEDDVIAKALGIRAQDVITARAAQRAFLRRKGKPCLGCSTIIDPTFGSYCTARCRDAHTS
jgi:hypothetical protein